MNNKESNLILQNSVIRTVLIDKEEYILLYKHHKLSTSSNDMRTLELGKLLIITKNPQSDKKYYQYVAKNNCIL